MTSIIRTQTATTYTRYTFPSTVNDHFEESVVRNDALLIGETSAQETLEKNYQAAYESGHATGYKNGFEKATKEGYDAGFLKGKKAFEKQSKVELGHALSGLNNAITHVQDMAFSMQDEIKNTSLEVIAKIAEKVVNKEISIDPKIILNWIETSIASLPKQPSVINITLNNGDYQRVISLVEEIDTNWALSASQTLPAGCCEVATELADISINPQEKIQSLLGQIQE